MIKYLSKIVMSLIIISMMNTFPVYARGLSILRDAETEAFLKRIGRPIFTAAKLTPESVHLYLINDKSINAFVTGGQNIFFHSGLLMRMENVDELHGVMAHETGHISGGHSVRTQEAFGKAANFSIASMVLGVAAILAGSPDAGMASIMAGQQMTRGTMLSYSRTQEATTDQAGAQFLQKSGISGKGLISFFEKLKDQELLYRANQDPYMRTHPLTSHRVSRLDNVVKRSPFYEANPNKELNDQFFRIKAKLEGYLNGPVFTLRKYPVTDQSVYAKYARIYAYHKALEWDLAIKEVDDLLKLEPNNPYFHEIKGQVLFESGKLEESLSPFKKASDLAPTEALILTAYSQALISIENKDGTVNTKNMKLALPILKEATRLDKDNTFAWFNLAKVYSNLKMPDHANLASAERFYSMGVMNRAHFHATMAKKEFKPGTIEWLRSEDILIVAEQSLEHLRRKKAKEEKTKSRRRVNSGF